MGTFYPIIAEELRSLGYSYSKNAKGSHEKWKSPTGKAVIVPHNIKSRHLANSLLKGVGSSKKL